MLQMLPDVHVVRWEVHFFDLDDKYSKGLEWYRQIMPLSYENQVSSIIFVIMEAVLFFERSYPI